MELLDWLVGLSGLIPKEIAGRYRLTSFQRINK
jgi:hypothetical protein